MTDGEEKVKKKKSFTAFRLVGEVVLFCSLTAMEVALSWWQQLRSRLVSSCMIDERYLAKWEPPE